MFSQIQTYSKTIWHRISHHFLLPPSPCSSCCICLPVPLQVCCLPCRLVFYPKAVWPPGNNIIHTGCLLLLIWSSETIILSCKRINAAGLRHLNWPYCVSGGVFKTSVPYPSLCVVGSVACSRMRGPWMWLELSALKGGQSGSAKF